MNLHNLTPANRNWSDLSDEELIQIYAEPEQQEAFNVLYNRHYGPLVKFVCERFNYSDPSAAEDIVQETFLDIHLRKSNYIPGKSFAKWLYWLAGNDAFNHSRNMKRQKRGGGVKTHSLPPARPDDKDAANPFEPAAKTDILSISDGDDDTLDFRQGRVYDALVCLDDEERQAITLIYVEGQGERSTAEAIGISRHRLRQILPVAEEKLRTYLREMAA